MKTVLALTISFVIGLIVMPIIIQSFKVLKVLDTPDQRKIHKISTPSMGGIAIFIAYFVSLIIALSFDQLSSFKYILFALLLIFLLGIRDDFSSLRASYKLLVQILAAVIAVYLGGVKLHGFEGLFGVINFPWHFNQMFTIGVIVIMVNAFNLIDGIDGLAGTVSLVISIFFAWFFIRTDQILLGILSIGLFGAVLSFLVYNWHPAKIFMGDTGSLTIGFLLIILMINFVRSCNSMVSEVIIESPVSLSLALFALPVYDTLRVFIVRFYNGKSPFVPDRNHLHHVLLKLGFNHSKSTIILITFNVLLISLALVLQPFGEVVILFTLGLLCISFGATLDFKAYKKLAKRHKTATVRHLKINKSA